MKKKEEKEEPRTFARAYEQLKKIDARVVKKVICQTNDWSDVLFAHKKRGIRGMTLRQADVVKSAFQCFGIDAWTGEAIRNENK